MADTSSLRVDFPRSRWSGARALAGIAMLASGMASLGCQIVWTQQSSQWLGHESPAVLAVLAAFFGGLALGAWWLGARIDRSARPARWYAACELLIGGWSLALAAGLAPVNEWLLAVTGTQPSALWQWSVAFCGTFVVLLPATAAMGATLPAIERTLARLHTEGIALAGLYAANTFGAALGVLLAAFWIVPAFGLLGTAACCAALNLLCAGLILAIDRAGPEGSSCTAARDARIDILLAVTGLLGIGYEVLVIRVLSQVAENTVYTYALLLAVYLVGTALGAAAYQRWLAARPRNGGMLRQRRDGLLQALAASCLIGMVALGAAPTLKANVTALLGVSLAAALLAEATLATAAFLLPTVAMGAVFSHLCTEARLAGSSIGRALGINTLGAAAAPLLFGVLLAPSISAKASLSIVTAGYVVLSVTRVRSAWRLAGLSVAVLAVAMLTPSLAFVDVPEGGRVLSQHEGALGVVSVVEDARGVATLRINNRQQEGSSATVTADARQALLPLLWHADPHRALFLGLGTGVTASAAAMDRRVAVDVVELLPEVVRASGHFTAALGDPPPPLGVVVADARRYVRSTSQRYDVIVADNFHPARSGSGALYTVEHFRAVKGRLADGGLFCQWLPLHQLDIATVRSIVRSFLEVFPEARAALATNSLDTPVLGLVGRTGDIPFDPALARRRIETNLLPMTLPDLGLADEWALWGSFVAGPRSLRQFALEAPLNTDDHPVVTYLAPRVTYAPDSRPRDRLLALLAAFGLTADELWGQSGGDAAQRARLSAYWTARDRFIAAGRDVEPSTDVRRMLAQVEQPLREILQTSPDFRPAYDPLLRMAVALGRTDPTAARALLTELSTLQPHRPEALQALEQFRR